MELQCKSKGLKQHASNDLRPSPHGPNNEQRMLRSWGVNPYLTSVIKSTRDRSCSKAHPANFEPIRSASPIVYAAAEGWSIPSCGLKIRDLTNFIAYVSNRLLLTGQDAQCAYRACVPAESHTLAETHPPPPPPCIHSSSLPSVCPSMQMKQCFGLLPFSSW